MELKRAFGKFRLPDFIRKYRYLLLVVLAGAALLAWPGGERKTASPAPAETPEYSLEQTEKKLADAISKIEGAGRVTVVLTLRSDWETVVAQDAVRESTVESSNGGTQSRRSESLSAVTLDGGSGDAVVVLERIYPKYQGALVVCQGADSARVRGEVLSAVSGLTGLGTDKITVSKMKSD